MKISKVLSIILVAAFALAALLVVLNMPVSIKRGVDFQVSCVRMPLYLKALDFMDRHYNYKLLVSDIVDPGDSPYERVMKIFNWTGNNIRPQPASLPVIDDHVWHIIVRGYGASDQFNDVFTTLCNYTGIDAFFDFIYTKDGSSAIPLSFVRIGKQWFIFDAYDQVYFKGDVGDFASLSQIRAGDWHVFNAGKSAKKKADYSEYFKNLPWIEKAGLKRANIQSPMKRLLFELSKYKSTY